MQKIKTFWYALVKTFTSPSYYGHVLKAPFSFSLKFFFFYFFLFSFIATTVITVQGLLPLNKFLQRLPAMATEAYPKELVITIRNGEISTNVPEPYSIPVERVEKIFNEYQKEVLGEQSDNIQNLLVIDTSAPASAETFRKYDTFALLTKNHISYLNDNGNIETVSLEKMQSVTIDQQLVKKAVDIIAPYLSFIIPLLILGIFFFILIFVPLVKLLYLLFFAVILLIGGKILSYPLPYGKAYQLGLHFVVIPTTIFGVLSLFNISIAIPFLETILLTILGFFILNHLKALR